MEPLSVSQAVGDENAHTFYTRCIRLHALGAVGRHKFIVEDALAVQKRREPVIRLNVEHIGDTIDYTCIRSVIVCSLWHTVQVKSVPLKLFNQAVLCAPVRNLEHARAVLTHTHKLVFCRIDIVQMLRAILHVVQSRVDPHGLVAHARVKRKHKAYILDRVVSADLTTNHKHTRGVLVRSWHHADLVECVDLWYVFGNDISLHDGPEHLKWLARRREQPHHHNVVEWVACGHQNVIPLPACDTIVSDKLHVHDFVGLQHGVVVLRKELSVLRDRVLKHGQHKVSRHAIITRAQALGLGVALQARDADAAVQSMR